jgi:hypothetical protein
MRAWMLLILTILCGYFTCDAFRWRSSIKRAPFSVIAGLWRGGLRHMSIAEQNRLKDRFASFGSDGAGKFALLLLVVTITLAMLTIRAFLGW